MVTALFLFFSGTTIFGQNIFKRSKNFGDEFGVQATETLNSGLIVFKRAHQEEVIEVVEPKAKEPKKPDNNVYFSYQYNFGYSKEKLILTEWSYDIKQLDYGYLLVEQPNYLLYDVKGKQIVDLETQQSPMLIGHLLIAKKEREIDSKENYYLSYKERQNLPSHYVFYDLSQKARKVFEDSLTKINQLDTLLYLQNSSEPSRSKLVNKKMKSILPMGVYPLIVLKEAVIVRDSTTQLAGFIDFNKNVIVPLAYEHFDVAQNPHIFGGISYSYNDSEFWISDKEHSFFIASRNDSSFLFNDKYDVIFATKKFTYEEANAPNKKIYLIIKADKREGLIDTDGHTIVPINYRTISFKDTYIEVTTAEPNPGQYDAYSYDGHKLFSGPYAYVRPLPSGLVVLENMPEEGSVNKEIWLANPMKNELLTSEPYHHYFGSDEGILRFKKEDHYFFYTISGEFLFSIKANYVGDFEDGRATVFVDKKEGAINTKGQWIEELKRIKRR